MHGGSKGVDGNGATESSNSSISRAGCHTATTLPRSGPILAHVMISTLPACTSVVATGGYDFNQHVRDAGCMVAGAPTAGCCCCRHDAERVCGLLVVGGAHCVVHGAPLLKVAAAAMLPGAVG